MSTVITRMALDYSTASNDDEGFQSWTRELDDAIKRVSAWIEEDTDATGA